jgi:hypothetical protein
LEIEIQFYVLVPLLALLFAIPSASIRRTVLAILMIASGSLSIVAHRNIHLRASILYYLAFFLAGFLVCDLYLTRREWQPSFRWDVLALCGWPLGWYFEGNVGHILLPFLIVVRYLAAFRGRICSAIFSNRIITHVGGDVLQHLPLPCAGHFRGKAPFDTVAHWTDFLGVLRAPGPIDLAVRINLLRSLLLDHRAPLYGQGLAS